jgi:hypothetical protein
MKQPHIEQEKVYKENGRMYPFLNFGIRDHAAWRNEIGQIHMKGDKDDKRGPGYSLKKPTPEFHEWLSLYD